MAGLSKAFRREPLRIRLTFDDGLAAYIRALVASPVGIYGDERETIVYLVRSGVIKLFESEVYRNAMMPYLPKDIQRAWSKNR